MVILTKWGGMLTPRSGLSMLKLRVSMPPCLLSEFGNKPESGNPLLLKICMMSTTLTRVQIKDWARRLGFDLAGVAPAQPPPQAEKLREYLAQGFHGDMSFLTRNVEKRLDPRRLLADARSIICLALNYFSLSPPAKEPAAEKTGTADKENQGIKTDQGIETDQGNGPFWGRLARYAWGRDYHQVLKERMRRLAGKIRTAAGSDIILRCFVDTAPLLEKAHAARAGLGWIGKNTLLLNEQFGSWLVLGEIVTDLELEYDQPVDDRCGDCTRCLQACPTAALGEPRVMDARRCISYLTSESGAEIPAQLAAKTGDWLLGCDLCQQVCPFNQQTPPTRESAFQTRWRRLRLDEVLSLDRDQFRQRFAGTSIGRADWRRLLQRARFCRNKMS